MSDTTRKFAISPTRQEDFPEWYQEVIKAADLAENSPVRGSMIIKPWGYGIWENIQATLDKRIKETGHENAYFPLFIPLSFLEKEASHVEGFAKECAVVTHHRLEQKDGKLVPSAPLEEPLIVRPTSETIIGDCYARWIESYRDLPILINQWANVVRWEMRPRIFLRTTEFLWQEGHTAHETEKEARDETMKMLGVYRELVEDFLAIPVILGEKSEGERFPGAVSTFTIETMMQDGKALQAGTSHYLGQNFAKAQEIKFSGRGGEIEYAHTTSWGATTRLIGGLVMVHADDDGLRLPPKIAPKQIVIIPVVPKPDQEKEVFLYAEKVASLLGSAEFNGQPLKVFIDRRDIRGGEKNWGWIKKGVPIRIEVGPRDISEQMVMLSRRDQDPQMKVKVPQSQLVSIVPQILSEIQDNLFRQAKEYQESKTRLDFTTLEEMRKFFNPKNPEKPEIHGGFVKAGWCADPATEALLKDMQVTIRCLPLNQSNRGLGKCILTGKPAKVEAIFAKSY